MIHPKLPDGDDRTLTEIQQEGEYRNMQLGCIEYFTYMD